jgi:putative FmdB family regulatory protein
VPTYQYACTSCGHQLEAVQSFSDAPLTECPACEGRLRKLFSSVGIVFKGSGFYRTDSRAGSGNGSGDGKAKESAGAATGSGESSSAKTDGASGSSTTGTGANGSSSSTGTKAANGSTKPAPAAA